jgi:hypothetical protein
MEWAEYRLAYGVFVLKHNSVGDSHSKLFALQWVDRRLSPPEYDPSLRELFEHTPVRQGQRYFLLMSRLEEGLRTLMRRDHPGNSPSFVHCLERYAPLYASFRAPVQPAPPAEPARPSRKRPASQEPRRAHVRLLLERLKLETF